MNRPAAKPKIYARPVKSGTRPASTGVQYYQSNKPLSMSETNLYYTDVAMRPQTGQSTRSTPTNSYINVYAEVRILSHYKSIS